MLKNFLHMNRLKLGAKLEWEQPYRVAGMVGKYDISFGECLIAAGFDA